jgi:hypothetical protein
MGECHVDRHGDGGLNPTVGGCISALGFAASDSTCRTYAFATGGGQILLTVDGGASWTDLDPGNVVPNRYVSDLAFAPTDGNTLYVTLSGFDEGTPSHPGHVFKTSHALTAPPTWSNVSPPANLPYDSIAVDPVDPQLVYAGADVGVWKSSDGGGSWIHMGPDIGMPNVPVYDLEIHATTHRPFAFTFGRGAFVIACRSDTECDDQNASNGVETCDRVSGRCLLSSACSDGTVAVSVVQPKLSIGKLNTPPGDDTLTFSGQLPLPSPLSPPLNPLSVGVRVLASGATGTEFEGTVFDVTIPGGAFAKPSGKGWKVNKAGTTWTYLDKTPAPVGGIYKAVIHDKSNVTPGLVKFSVKGKAGHYAVAPTDLPVTARMILGSAGGQCGHTSFATCAFNRSGSTLKCK